MRVASDKPTKNGGYIHRLSDDWTPPRFERPKPLKPKPQRNWSALAAKYHAAMTADGFAHLSFELGLSIETFKAIRVGWDGSQSRYTFPMRNAAGNVVGIRTREKHGKRSISGSDGNGLFFVPSMVSADYLIVCEGPTDTAALIDAGFNSSVGKPSCKLGDDYVVEVLRNLKPAAVLLIPDSDSHGLKGFTILANAILQSGVMPFERIDSLIPPQPLKDVRQWLRKSREHLAGRIAAKLETIKQRSGGSSND
jgi:hypothetical protein